VTINGLSAGIFGSTPTSKVEKSLKVEKTSKGDKSVKVGGPPRLLVGAELEAFKIAVNGSDDTKVVLLGLLKKQ